MEFGPDGPRVHDRQRLCASANHAIAYRAADAAQSGACDVAITGGTEATIALGPMRGWGEAMRIMAPDACRTVLRRAAARHGARRGRRHLRARAARPQPWRAAPRSSPELAGTGMSSDASDITLPNVAGPTSAMRLALADAGPRARGDRLHQRARHRHRRQRRDRDQGDPRGCSARTRASSRCRRPSRCTATRWGQRAASSSPPPCSRCSTTSCRPTINYTGCRSRLRPRSRAQRAARAHDRRPPSPTPSPSAGLNAVGLAVEALRGLARLPLGPIAGRSIASRDVATQNVAGDSGGRIGNQPRARVAAPCGCGRIDFRIGAAAAKIVDIEASRRRRSGRGYIPILK